MSDLRPPSVDTSERDVLRAFVDYLRRSLVAKVDGLTEEQARRPLVPSGTNLLGLVQHMTAGESYWFDWVFLGSPGEEPDFTMTVPPDRSTAEVVAAFESAVRRSNEIVAGHDLDERAARSLGGREPHTLRWILVHLVEEYGRHAGHADIIRELLDGSTGR